MAVTKPFIEKFLKLQADRRDLQRKADSIEREEKLLKDELREFAEASGGSAEKGPYIVRLVEKPGTPKWKDEFIRKCGAKAAEKISKACLPVQSLEVVDTRVAK